MFEIAGGVVLGGIVLFVLAAFAEPLLKLALIALGVIAAIALAVLAGYLLNEAYEGYVILADHPTHNLTDAESRAAGLAMLVTLSAIVWLGKTLWGRLIARGQASPSKSTGRVQRAVHVVAYMLWFPVDEPE